MTDYKGKYLKYKNKYLELKSQLGGAFPFLFGEGGKISIMANITGPTLDRVNQRRVRLGLPYLHTLHITLLEIHINFANVRSNIFYDPQLIDVIVQSFNQHLKGPGVEIASGMGGWDFFGFGPSLENKYWARIYTLPHNFRERVTSFRMAIYDFITAHVGNLTRKFDPRQNPADQHDITNYVIYSTGNGQNRDDELYAVVRDHYHGVDTWRPHISVIRMIELQQGQLQIPGQQKSQRQLFDEVNQLQTTQERSDHITMTIGQVPPISRIRMVTDINQLHISINVPRPILVRAVARLGHPINTEYRRDV